MAIDDLSNGLSHLDDELEGVSLDWMMKWFDYRHLPDGEIQETSSAFHDLAIKVCKNIAGGPERTVALRKLLEAKDAAVRAVVHPGG